MLLYIIRHGDPNYNPDSLTERGKSLMKVLDQLCDWGNENRL